MEIMTTMTTAVVTKERNSRLAMVKAIIPALHGLTEYVRASADDAKRALFWEMDVPVSDGTAVSAHEFRHSPKITKYGVS